MTREQKQNRSVESVQPEGLFAVINRAGMDRYECEVWGCFNNERAAISYAHPRGFRVIKSARGATMTTGESVPVDMIGRTYAVVR